MMKITVDGRTLSIRPARENDDRLLAGLGASTFSDAYSCALSAENLADYNREAFSPERMLEDIANPDVLLFLGFISDAPCAYIKLQPTPPRECVRQPSAIELSRLYVVHSWKGHGIGTALMDVAFKAARERSYKTCWLKVWDKNVRAIEFYTNKGFAIVGNEPYPVASTSENVVLMACSIES